MTKKFRVRLIFIPLLLFLFFVIYSAFSIWSFSSKNQLVQTDVAVVLGAAVWGNEPSPVFRARINHAIWLYENEYVEKIIFTGGKGGANQYTESEAARDYAVRHNVPVEDIFTETKSTITEENLTYAYEIAQKENFNTFTIVSDPLHMKRAMTMAKQTGMDAYSSPTQSSAYQTLKTKVPFFFRELFFYVGYLFTLPFR